VTPYETPSGETAAHRYRVTVSTVEIVEADDPGAAREVALNRVRDALDEQRILDIFTVEAEETSDPEDQDPDAEARREMEAAKREELVYEETHHETVRRDLPGGPA
jgi:hypothetical protein